MEKFLVMQTVHFLNGAVVQLPMQLYGDKAAASARVRELEGMFAAAMVMGVVERADGGRVKVVGDVQHMIPAILGIAKVEYASHAVMEEGLIQRPQAMVSA